MGEIRLTPMTALAEFGRLTNTGGMSRRAALKTLAVQFDLPARTIFDLLEQAKRSGE